MTFYVVASSEESALEDGPRHVELSSAGDEYKSMHPKTGFAVYRVNVDLVHPNPWPTEN